MGQTSEAATRRHTSHSVIIIPRNTPGVKVVRPLHVMGYDDAPYGHAEILFENVRVPKSNIIAGVGKGFEVVQGRLGPGRLHHCMRTIGLGERALKLLMSRLTSSRQTFSVPLYKHELLLERVARSRIIIERNRLLVLMAARKIDLEGPKSAKREIAWCKISVPTEIHQLIDWAIQAHGAEGLCEVPLSHRQTAHLPKGPDRILTH